MGMLPERDVDSLLSKVIANTSEIATIQAAKRDPVTHSWQTFLDHRTESQAEDASALDWVLNETGCNEMAWGYWWQGSKHRTHVSGSQSCVHAVLGT